MLSPEQRKALYSGTEMPKDGKGLGYQYQMMMVIVASPEDSPGPSESHDKDLQTEKDDETVEPTQLRPALEEGGQATQVELLEINLHTSKDPRPTFINGSMSPREKDAYLEFLNHNRDVFAWTYSEMPGLDPAIAMHRLAIEPDQQPVKQAPSVCILTLQLKSKPRSTG